MLVYSFYIKIQRFSSIGRRSIKIVRGSESGTIFSTLSQRNLNSRSSDIDKTSGKLCMTQIMNFGTKIFLFPVNEKKIFSKITTINFLLFLKNIRFF